MADPRLRIHTVVAHLGSFTLGPCTLSFEPGICWLVGPNGAGKTTLLRVLSGLTKPASGVVERRGQAVLMPQDLDLPRLATPRQYLTHVSWLAATPRDQRDARVQRVMEAVGIVDRGGDRMSTLSGGMQRRVGIAAALVPDNGCLLLDEPLVGLDPVQRGDVQRLCAGWSRQPPSSSQLMS